MTLQVLGGATHSEHFGGWDMVPFDAALTQLRRQAADRTLH
ncbi:MAG: hypothetical protein P8L68_16145 [Paracoccaceae bacterium]|nr:hypothetical protein [Paracoccaceae bacterium]MDG2260016.1 hypothetical protein [Paracoccaceae bacterium]